MLLYHHVAHGIAIRPVPGGVDLLQLPIELLPLRIARLLLLAQCLGTLLQVGVQRLDSLGRHAFGILLLQIRHAHRSLAI